ncbi:MAG: hypothetical protein LUD22_02860 [Coprobacillus sp.]|nr:hypothetical protein [Coprobacillus sp.]
MKKTKLFTSIAALALVLGLGACDVTSEEETTPSESESTTQSSETTGDTTPSESTPEGGNDGGEAEPRSVLGALDATNYCYKYFNGKSGYNGYTTYLDVTADWDEAVDVTLTEGTEGVAISFESDEGTRYLSYYYDGSNHNVLFAEEPYYWYVGTENGAFYTSQGGRYLGLAADGGSIRTYSATGYSIATIYEYEPEAPEAPEAPEVPNLELATSLTSGSEYYLAYKADGDTYYYFDGSKFGNYDSYLGATTSIESAVKVTVTGDDTNGWTITFNGNTLEAWSNYNNSKYYGEITYYSGTSTYNGVTTFAWNSTYNTVTVVLTHASGTTTTYYLEYNLYNSTHEIQLNDISYIGSTGKAFQFFTLAA